MAALSHNRGHGLADIADLAARQRMECGRVIIPHPRSGKERLEQTFDLSRGEDADHTRHCLCRRGVDTGDQRMRIIAAAEGEMQRARNRAVVGEAALAGQQPPVLDALDAGPDVLRPHPQPEIRLVQFRTRHHRPIASSTRFARSLKTHDSMAVGNPHPRTTWRAGLSSRSSS
jgi:hypothetical protein